MSHPEITFDDVATAAACLRDDGQPLTIASLHATLGRSPTAIARHLHAWRASEAPTTAAPEAQLPASLLADLANWARDYAEQAGAGTQAALAQLESDMDGLLEAGEQLESTCDSLQGDLDNVASARDQALATAAQQNEEIERLNAELRNARQVAMEALVGKAKDQLAIDGKEEQLIDLRAQLERNVAASAAQSDARLKAEMDLIGAVTARDSLESDLRGLQAQLSAANAERTALRAELDVLRARAK